MVMRKPVRILVVLTSQLPLMLAACGSEADLGGLASNGTTLAGMGRMVVQVSGLPAGASSAIVVTGPNGFNRLVARTDTLDNLVPGIYTIDADSIVSNANVYAPNLLVMNVSISAGRNRDVHHQRIGSVYV